jgi:hypothetical protein
LDKIEKTLNKRTEPSTNIVDLTSQNDSQQRKRQRIINAENEQISVVSPNHYTSTNTVLVDIEEQKQPLGSPTSPDSKSSESLESSQSNEIIQTNNNYVHHWKIYVEREGQNSYSSIDLTFEKKKRNRPNVYEIKQAIYTQIGIPPINQVL